MVSAYESSREEFNKISENYYSYLRLYIFFNNGSAEGATPFDEFYWVHTYHSQYREGEEVAERY